MNFIVTRPSCVLGAVFGSLFIRKGYNECRNDHKISGLAKMTFGALVTSGSIAYALYSDNSSIPPLEKCDPDLKEKSHTGCEKLLETVQNALNNSEIKFINPIKDGSSVSFPALSPNLYDNLNCTINKTEPSTMECFITPNQFGMTALMTGNINIVHGQSTGYWQPTLNSVNDNIDNRPTPHDILKTIPGCEQLKKLQIHLKIPTTK